ncbi:hypothetical protein [Candidatus Rhabdochlamydia porcellionis]|uniref:Transmembrane protein n=1 Tax=Candidatus Rhabdochlamydia porcellionis TaxID=225148 RepID=A0ABX8Z0S0_9BACT|nr:hypothetical protein [Candidatus Rhabdochlamydia porcellionis]QZA58478.1 hypothetical protein RHAB15C_0000352 [Candidatus Rhabdochlamydia porcellionis]
MTIKFHPVLQIQKNPHTVTVDLSSSSSNRSWLARKKIVIGSITGVAVAAATAYFFINQALTETAFSSNTTETSTFFINQALTETVFSSNTTETSTEYFTDSTELPMNESIRSLHNIVKLVTTGPDYYDNCASAFQAHWARFKECGTTVNDCMKNSIKLFDKLFCKPSTHSFGYVDDRSKACEKNYFALARCNM